MECYARYSYPIPIVEMPKLLGEEPRYKVPVRGIGEPLRSPHHHQVLLAYNDNRVTRNISPFLLLADIAWNHFSSFPGFTRSAPSSHLYLVESSACRPSKIRRRIDVSRGKCCERIAATLCSDSPSPQHNNIDHPTPSNPNRVLEGVCVDINVVSHQPTSWITLWRIIHEPWATSPLSLRFLFLVSFAS